MRSNLNGAEFRSTLYVAALNPNHKLGTLEEQILLFGKSFREHRSTFVPLFVEAPAGEAADRCVAADVPAYGIDLWGFGAGRFRALCRLVDRHRIEVVNWNFYDPLSPYMLALRVARPAVKHIFTHHSSRTWPLVHPLGPVRHFVKASLLRGYEVVLGVSDFVVRCLDEERLWGRTERFFHFVNLDRFAPDAAERALTRAEHRVNSAFVIATVAQLIEEKGLHVLLDAVATLPSDVVVWIIGEGPYRGALEAQARRLGIADRVCFLGLQVRVEPFMRAADVAVCPSVWAEAAGLVNLEAQASGVPLVASNVGGIPEFIHHERTGLLFTPGRSDELASCLRRLRADPDLRQRFARGAREFAESTFGVEPNLERNLAVYGRSR
jgi:glycosyltransferase involved in cell wall biosynthesis